MKDEMGRACFMYGRKILYAHAGFRRWDDYYNGF
jgi:hypothetical protein